MDPSKSDISGKYVFVNWNFQRFVRITMSEVHSTRPAMLVPRRCRQSHCDIICQIRCLCHHHSCAIRPHFRRGQASYCRNRRRPLKAQLHSLRLDVASRKSVEAAANEVRSLLGHLGLILHGARVWSTGLQFAILTAIRGGVPGRRLSSTYNFVMRITAKASGNQTF